MLWVVKEAQEAAADSNTPISPTPPMKPCGSLSLKGVAGIGDGGVEEDLSHGSSGESSTFFLDYQAKERVSLRCES